MMQQSRKMWPNFVCPLGPFLLAQSHLHGKVPIVKITLYNIIHDKVPIVKITLHNIITHYT